MAKYADLHLHTNASDGEYSPQEVVKAAYKQGFSAISITDHDTLSGIEEAREACQKLGIEFISGIEISTLWEGKEIHILGYFLEKADGHFLEKLTEMKNSRKERIRKMVRRLNDLGYNISLDKVQEIAGVGAIGRPHVAKALLEKNYVKSIKEAFIKLLSPGCPGYVPRYKINPFEAIELIKGISGIPVIAHPGINHDEDLLYKLAKAGLLGIEVWHPEHNEFLTKKYFQIARKCDLLITGGSDWHGHNKEDTALGIIKLDYKYVEELKRKKKELSLITFT